MRLPGGMTGGMADRTGIGPIAIYGSSGPPADFGSPVYSWWAPTGLYSDDSATTPQTTNGGVIANWKDRIANALYAQTTNGLRPTLNTSANGGKWGVVFDGTDDIMNVGSISYGNPFTEFLALKIHQVPATATILAGRNSSGVDFRAQSTGTAGTLAMDPTGGGPTVTGYTNDTFIVLCCVWDASSTTRIRINAGTSSSTPNIAPTTGTATNRRLGGGSGASITGITVLADVIYASALSTSDETSERNVINGYFAIF